MYPEETVSRSPHSLADQVRAELHWIDHFDVSTLSVSESAGRVVIRGVVDTWLARENAVRAARGVPGVRAIDVSELRVRVGRTDHPTDAELTRAARESLRWHLSVPHHAVHARVSGGTVILEGRVLDLCQRKAAEEAVRPLVGVTEVRNLLGSAPRSPEKS